jgi:hypothetical protein
MLDETKRQEIIERAAEAARLEIETEERKSAGELRAEALKAELGAVSASLKELQKFPSRYKAQIATAATRQDAIIRELDELGAMPKAYQPAGNGRITLVSGGQAVNWDPRYPSTKREGE